MRGLPETRAQARQAPWFACAGREVALFCLVRPLSVCADLYAREQAHSPLGYTQKLP